MTTKDWPSFIRYVAVGGSAFAIEYLSYLLLYRVMGLDYIVAGVIVYSIIFWFVFWFNRVWSFQSTARLMPQLVKYVVLFAFNNLVGNVLLMRLLTVELGISPLIAPVLKMGCIVIWNYYIYKHFIYRA